MKQTSTRIAIGILGLGLMMGGIGGCKPAKVPPDMMARIEAAANRAEASANSAAAAAKSASDAAARAEAAADKLATRYHGPNK